MSFHKKGCLIALVTLVANIQVEAQADAHVISNPTIENYGGIYAIPDADVAPNANLDYKIVVDVPTGAAKPELLNQSLNNVARMINLHAVGGASVSRMHVVLAIHAEAAYAVLSNLAYNERFGVDNPNIELLGELQASRVDITICGQSMIARGISRGQLADGVKVATSMLTTVTTYQSLGYSFLKF